MKEWFSNSVSWLSSGTSQQNQPQSPFHGFPQPSQIPNSHHPPLYQPQSPQHVQFGQKVSSQDQMHNQRPQHLPNNDMERKNTMIQELKDNYDGCAYTLADREIREVYEANNWNSALATPIIIDLFSKNRTEYFCSIYTDIGKEDVKSVVDSTPEDRKIISVLNEKREEIVGGKLSEALQEIQKQNIKIAEQNNYIQSLEISISELKEKLVSESENYSAVIKRLTNENLVLSNQLSILQNEKMDSDDAIKSLRKSNRLLLNEIQELKEGTCIKVPNSVDFGTPIQVVWKLEGFSNASDWIGLFDYNGTLISQQNIDSQGLKSGKMTFEAPTNYGEYCFKYHFMTSSFLGMTSSTILCVSNIIKVGPTYSIIEEKNVPGEIILQIHRESGKFYFHSFTFGMYHIGGAYDEYIEMYDAKEGENITFHPNKDVPLYNYEFKVFGEMSEGVICTLCTLGHTSFIQKRKRETFKSTNNSDSIILGEDEESRSVKKKRSNSEIRVEEVDIDSDDSEESRAYSVAKPYSLEQALRQLQNSDQSIDSGDEGSENLIDSDNSS